MDFLKALGAVTLVALLAGCESAQEKAADAQADAAKAQQSAAEAQEKVTKQRLELVGKYQTCVQNAAGDQQKAAACDSYLKAAEALN
jgi:F0F1-type ATP synthase membrane subunit b/b'